MNQKHPTLSILAKTYLLALSIFTIFRVLLFLTEKYRLTGKQVKIKDILAAFGMGFRFDLSLASYVLILPALLLFVWEIGMPHRRFIPKLVFWLVFVLFCVSFFISAADIPYFHHFFSHFSVGAFAWMDNPEVVTSMIFTDTSFYKYFGLFFLVLLIFYRLLKRIFAQANPVARKNKKTLFLRAIISLLLLFLGLRGSVGERPLLVRDAYISNDVFLNELGENPPYFFLRSYLDQVETGEKPLHFMDNAQAFSLVQKYLGMDTVAYEIPTGRAIQPDSVNPNKPNVVIILMESLSTAKMGRYGNPHELTPFLDSLSYRSYYFDHLYSAGEHTFNGIFGTLFSHPSIYRMHPLKDVKAYDGMPHVMRKLGYKTLFFTTHSEKFDNIYGFLINNDFERIYSMKDYPKEEIKTTFGVPDDYLFRYAMPILDSLQKKNQPFFATLLTTSDHLPFYLPDYFKPKSKVKEWQMTQYADWSIQQFFEMAKQKPWFDNTIFVLLGDHGAPMDVKYDISLNYHHIPMIIYAPKFVQAKQVSKIAGQIDCFPTIMGITNQPYINTTLGIDLRKQDRPYIFINGDDKLAVLDTSFLLIQKQDKSVGLYKYPKEDHTNYAEQYPEKVQDMLQYMNANLQTYYYINRNANQLQLK